MTTSNSDVNTSDALRGLGDLAALNARQVAIPSVQALGTDDEGYFHFSIRHSLTPEHAAYFAKGGIKLDWRKPNNRRHQHGACNISRGLAEWHMWDLINSTHQDSRLSIDDIGSNVARTDAMIRQAGCSGRVRMHFMVPDILPGDSRRRMAVSGHEHCSHRLQECNCGNKPDFAVSTHCLYYLTPDDIGRALLHRYGQHLMYGIVHRMDQVSGALVAGDLTYRMHLDGMIHAEAANDSHGYVHPPNDWMFQQVIATSSGAVYSEVLYHQFDSYILRFTLANHDVIYRTPRSATFDSVLQENVYGDKLRLSAGMTHEMRTLMSLAPHELPSVDIHAYSSYVGVVVGTENRAFIPKHLISTLAADMAYTERTLSSLRTAVARCRSICNHSGVPAELLEPIVLYAPVLAWLRNLSKETAILGRAVATRRRLIAAHQDALNLKGVSKTHACWSLNPFNWCNRDFETDEAVRFTPREPDFVEYCIKTRIPCVVAAPVVLGDRQFVSPSEPKSRELPKLALGCSYRHVGEPRVPPNDGNQFLSAGGIVFPTHVPTLVPFTQDSAVLALCQRTLKDYGVPPDPLAWDMITKKRRDKNSALCDPYVFKEPEVLNETNVNTWIEHYPENQRKAFYDAWKSLSETNNQLNARDFRMGGFIKLEKGVPAHIQGTTPRAIFSMSPRAAVCACPIFKLVGQSYRMKFGPENVIFWASGHTAEELGAYFDRAYDLFGPEMMVIDTDQEKFEGHRSLESFTSYYSINDLWCHSRKYGSCVRHMRRAKVVFPRDATVATITNKLASGTGDVSLLSFVDNAATVVYSMGEPIIDDEVQYVAMANGDDATLFGLFTQKHLDAAYHKARDLGFETTVALLHPRKSMFCRNRPWPSDRGTIYGPCIGWIIARLGWHVKDPRGWSPGAVARGLQNTCNHIPFLRLFIAKMIEVTKEEPQAPTPEWAFRSTVSANPVPESYAMCYEIYGLTESDEQDFAHLLSSVTVMGTALNWPHLEHCFKVDM